MGDFVLIGSQQFGPMSRITPLLAGRVSLVHLLPLSLGPGEGAANYVATCIERDVRLSLCGARRAAVRLSDALSVTSSGRYGLRHWCPKPGRRNRPRSDVTRQVLAPTGCRHGGRFCRRTFGTAAQMP